LPGLQEIGRPQARKRIPVVLSTDEVARVLSQLTGELGLLARLLYGTGLRLSEGLGLRVKDLDFERRLIVVREGKGGKDRVVMLPGSLLVPLQAQLDRAREVWDRDRAANTGGVWMPDSPARISARCLQLELVLGVSCTEDVHRPAHRRHPEAPSI
jgi:integrase